MSAGILAYRRGGRGLEVLLGSGATRIVVPGPSQRAKSMLRMLQSRSRGASLPRSSATALRLVHSNRSGRSGSEEGSASSHSQAKAILTRLR